MQANRIANHQNRQVQPCAQPGNQPIRKEISQAGQVRLLPLKMGLHKIDTGVVFADRTRRERVLQACPKIHHQR